MDNPFYNPSNIFVIMNYEKFSLNELSAVDEQDVQKSETQLGEL